MHRLFVAVRPPRAIREQLLDMMEGVPNARWQDEEQLHLTLRFIGNVDPHQAEDIAFALQNVSHPPFHVRLSGVGSFERSGRGTLWAGLSPREDLEALHKKVDQACVRVGIAPDNRAYHPHITLARIGRSTGPRELYLQHWAGLSGSDFLIDEFRLYESRLGSEGASYTTVARYPTR
jgi:2'-5' RNA ligase